MARKNRKRKRPDVLQKAAEFSANPFADLKLDLPAGDESKSKPKPKAESPGKSSLDADDRELLRAFGEQSIEFGPKPPLVTVGIQRKGKGGKTVTWVQGLERLGLLEQQPGHLRLLLHRDHRLGAASAGATGRAADRHGHARGAGRPPDSS